MKPATIDRREFLAERWSYQPGQHVTFLGATGSGKTRLSFQLAQVTAHERLPIMALVMKPRDREVAAWQRDMGLRRVPAWPPPARPFSRRPPGWLVWPKHTFDPDRDDPHMRQVFRHAILSGYQAGDRIIFADEVAGLTQELKLSRELETVWMRGRVMGCGLWAASQRPAYIPLHAYSQAHHLFLGQEPDKRSRERLGEIGNFDGRDIERAVATLPKYHFLYLNRDGHYAVISP